MTDSAYVMRGWDRLRLPPPSTNREFLEVIKDALVAKKNVVVSANGAPRTATYRPPDKSYIDVWLNISEVLNV